MKSERPADFSAKIIFSDHGAFANGSTLTADTIGVVLSTTEGNFQAMLDLRAARPIYASKDYTVPVYLIDNDAFSPLFTHGRTFDLVTHKIIGRGSVIEI